MVSESNFVVRKSGRRDESYYIDYLGVYKINDLARIVGVKASSVKEKFLNNNAVYDEALEVYYFNSMDSAKNTIAEIMKDVKSDVKGRVVHLTEAEIEYIRKALINEGTNVMHVSNKVKDAIFKKLNDN